MPPEIGPTPRLQWCAAAELESLGDRHKLRGHAVGGKVAEVGIPPFLSTTCSLARRVNDQTSLEVLDIGDENHVWGPGQHRWSYR